MNREDNPGKKERVRFLVTGGRGVLGKRVMALLSSNPNFDVVSLPGDVRDRESIRAFFSSNQMFTNLIHAAAIVPTDSVQNDIKNAYSVNVVGTWVIIEEFLNQNKLGHVTHVSSSHVYRPSRRRLSEYSRLGPSGSYGRTKLAGELVATDLCSKNSSPLCIARLFSLYSEDQEGSFLLPSLKRKIETSGPNPKIEIFGWNNVRDFSSADFYARALVHLAVKSREGTFNVGSGRGKSVLGFARSQFSFKLISRSSTRDWPRNKMVANVNKLRNTGFKFD